ncbi:glycoside hydrolase family 38 N-terminal domain-containing protein [Sphingobacterium chuzhouense]|uniref:Glycosyl hydrolase family 38 n=1 Tax=Sphingobacterium chuzhouense TaxID=1742264 RepID=A0ABR7XXC1_9SPHI|nr:glycosyl hydrolase family 38 [Sphingobacterium chuzhouense]MBD1423710.1 glycosyl hydrolase family 38 [Sphingobacterium chuzhouense]
MIRFFLFIILQIGLQWTLLSAQETSIWQELPASHVQVSASSEFEHFAAENLLTDKSFVQGRLVKNAQGRDMWLSKVAEHNVQGNQQVPKGKGWILFEFDKPYTLEQMGIWNYNQNDHTKRGLNKVYIHYTQDDKHWKPLRNGEKDHFYFPESGGSFEQDMDLSIALRGLEIKGLWITIDADSGNHYHVPHNAGILQDAKRRAQNINYYGLGKVRFYTRKKLPIGQLPKLDGLQFIAAQGYRKTQDGPAREFRLTFDQPLYTGGKLRLQCRGQQKILHIPTSERGLYEFRGTLTAGLMENEEQLQLVFESLQGKIEKQLNIPGARKWEIHFLAHSHQDIGYTHRQAEVLRRQWDNLELALDLIDRTEHYPPHAQFKWNTEATWYLHAYLQQYEDTPKAARLKQAIRNGRIGVDASLGSMLSGISRQEELMHYFDDAQTLEKELGMEFQSVLFSDVPGAVWGMTSALAQNKINYFSSAPNYTPSYPGGGSRLAHFHRIWGNKPFYWTSASGEDKVLYWATGTGYSLFHSWIYDRLSVCGLDPIWEILQNMENEAYPYSISYMRYTIHGDNGPPDREMADVIKKWNETYAYPKFSISTTQEAFEALEGRYGNVLPSYTGDLSPVWEDGAASSARELGINRRTAEKLNQLEVQWTILSPTDFPMERFKAGWKYVNLFSEHTWGASNSFHDKNSAFTKDLWEEKKGYALAADSISRTLEAELMDKIRQEEGDYIQVLNSNSWVRTDLVSFVSHRDLHSLSIQDEQGNIFPLQQQQNGNWCFLAKDIPPLASRVYRLVNHKRNYPLTLQTQDDEMASDRVKIGLDEQGVITLLTFDKDPHNYAGAEGLNGFVHSKRGLEELSDEVTNTMVRIIENGPVFAVIRIESDAPGCEKLYKELTLIRGIDRLDIANTIDKSETDGFENLRFHFDFNVTNPEINLDQAWCSIFPERQQLRGVNKNYYAVQNQLSVMNSDRAIVLTTTEAPFIELGNMSAEGWRTQSRSRTDWQLSASLGNSHIYSWVMNNSWTTNYKASQPGITSFHYSISPSSPDNLAAHKRKGTEAVQKLTTICTSNKMPIATPFEIVGTKQVALSTMKMIDGNLFLRLFNQDDATSRFQIDWKNFKHYHKYNCDNKGQIISKLDEEDLWLKPYAVQNILVTLNNVTK